MFEHVGLKNYAEFFDKSAELLHEDGVMLLHTIGQADGPSPTNPFIEKHIFPGGYIPSLSEVMPHIERAGLVVTDIEFLRLHYAKTLKAWRERFLAHWDEAKALYDERFCRMWEFYLAASESAFRWQGLLNFQIQLAHKVDTVPLTRDYMYEEEKRLAALDGRAAPISANGAGHARQKAPCHGLLIRPPQKSHGQAGAGGKTAFCPRAGGGAVNNGKGVTIPAAVARARAAEALEQFPGHELRKGKETGSCAIP